MFNAKNQLASCSVQHRSLLVGRMEGPGDVSLLGGTTVRRTLSLAQMLLLNAIVCGLEFCASAAFCYIPPMLLKAGISEERMSMILGVGPLLGFLLVPAIGRASDNCQSRYGRRRPFILALSLILLSSLIIIPYGEQFGVYMLGPSAFSKEMGKVLLVVGAIILDFASQACLTPCEALLSDASRNTDQHDRCFLMYSFMVSLGGCIGYLITALDWGNNSIGILFGSQEKSAFSLLIILFTVSMFATLAVADESPFVPESARQLDVESAQSEDVSIQVSKKLDQVHRSILQQKAIIDGTPFPNPNDPGYESGSNHSTDDHQVPLLETPPHGDTTTKPRGLNTRLSDIYERNCHIPLAKFSVSLSNFDNLTHYCLMRLYNLLPDSMKMLLQMPVVLRRLAFANFCSWTAVMGFNLFFTDFVGQAVYGGNPNAPEDSPEALLYDIGVRSGSWGLLFHCITAAFYAPFVEKIVNRYGMRVCYFLGMFIFTLVMAAMVFTRNVYLVNLLAACTGFGYATVTTIPFMLVTMYHKHKEIFFYDTRNSESTLPSRGMGCDMATLDSAYFLSQVILSAVMGSVVHYTGTVLSYIVVACSMGAVACMSITQIVYCKAQMHQMVRDDKQLRPMYE